MKFQFSVTTKFFVIESSSKILETIPSSKILETIPENLVDNEVFEIENQRSEIAVNSELLLACKWTPKR